MPQANQSANLVNLLRKIPPKWALGILACLVVYWLAQPLLNRSFGWHLPSLASFVAEPPEFKRPQRPDEDARPPTDRTSPPSKSVESESRASVPTTKAESTPKVLPKSEATKKASTSTTTAPRKADREDTAELAKKLGVGGQSDLRFGYLKEVGRDRYQSPAGLFYVRGSEEGHRLKHIQRHLEDQPTRPGSHGVFDGDMPQVLRWIDEAYQKASKGDRMAKKRDEGESTIYEFTFPKQIGYLGGSDGKRKRNPPTSRLRLVVIDRNVITAFPF